MYTGYLEKLDDRLSSDPYGPPLPTSPSNQKGNDSDAIH